MHIVFISPIAADNSGGAHRPAQFARELSQRGHSVAYIEIEKSRASDESPLVLNLQQLGWDEQHVVRAWYGFDYAAPQDLEARLQHVISDEPGVVICSAPFRPALELLAPFAARGYAFVYDVLDDISEMRALNVFCYDDVAETYLAENSDLIVTLSPRLREKFRSQKNVALIRDGVDLEPFRVQDPRVFYGEPSSPNPAGLVRGEITLGFWGTMWDYNLDVPLLQTLTRARPNWQWHFIGAHDLDAARPSIASALASHNAHFHPSVTRETLAQYATHFDACVLPTPVTPFNLARDPLKVYEYLACYKPVIATHLEQLADMPHVYLARDANEFLQHIERAAQEPISRAELDTYLAEQTWAKRTDALWKELNALPHHARTLPPPPRGAIPNADRETDRWRAYAQHLERIVQDRENHIGDLENALRESTVSKKIKRALKLD